MEFLMYTLGGGHFSPHRMPVANEGLGWDPLLILVVTGILGRGATPNG